VVTIEEVAAQAHRIMVERPVRVRALIVSPETGYELQQQMWLDITRPLSQPIRPPGLYEPGPIGLDMVTDPHLSLGVWRLADEHGTLLYDSRQGKVVP
jgi:hypothetical protein